MLDQSDINSQSKCVQLTRNTPNFQVTPSIFSCYRVNSLQTNVIWTTIQTIKVTLRESKREGGREGERVNKVREREGRWKKGDVFHVRLLLKRRSKVLAEECEDGTRSETRIASMRVVVVYLCMHSNALCCLPKVDITALYHARIRECRHMPELRVLNRLLNRARAIS